MARLSATELYGDLTMLPTTDANGKLVPPKITFGAGNIVSYAPRYDDNNNLLGMRISVGQTILDLNSDWSINFKNSNITDSTTKEPVSLIKISADGIDVTGSNMQVKVNHTPTASTDVVTKQYFEEKYTSKKLTNVDVSTSGANYVFSYDSTTGTLYILSR